MTLIEPGGFSTDWSGSSSRRAEALPAYDGFKVEVAKARAARQTSPGDPHASSAAVLAIVDAAKPPLRIFFGDGPLAIATADYESRLATWREWEPTSIAAHGAG